MTKSFVLAAASAAALAFVLAPATASPVAPLQALKNAAPSSALEQVHGWHRTCRKGFTDIHRHIKGVGRVTCKSRRCTTDFLGFKSCTYS